MENRCIEIAEVFYLNVKNEKINEKPLVAQHSCYRQNLAKVILRQKNAISAISQFSWSPV